MQIFSKLLSETDINKRCVVPMKYFKMKRFPKPKLEGSHMEDFVVTDESGQDWILCCSKRNIGEDRRIKVEKRTSPPEARWSPVMNEHLDGNNDSISHNSHNEATAIFQHLLVGVLNRDLGGNTAVKTSSIDKEQIRSPRSTSQHTACYKTERPSQSLSLELTLKPTMTGGMTAATSSGIDKEQKPTFHSTFQDIACNKTETLSLSLSLGLTLKPTMTGGQQHAYMQETEPKTIDFLSSF